MENTFGFLNFLKNYIFFKYLNLLKLKTMPEFNAFAL